MAKKTLSGRIFKWLKQGSNILSLVAIIISFVSLQHDLFPPPQRAKLTVFIDGYAFWYGTANELVFDVEGTIVNDSPLTGQIKTWNLTVVFDVPYRSLRSTFSMNERKLYPSSQANFTMSRTLIGENNTRIPDNSIRSFLVEFWFEDSVGMQVAQRELHFM
jgi:hypothetical protein